MGKLFSLIVIVALGYTGIYFYYGVVVEREIQEQLDDRGLSAVSIDNVEYDVLAPVSTSAEIAVTVTYRGSQRWIWQCRATLCFLMKSRSNLMVYRHYGWASASGSKMQ